jgi:hypothetical protein
LQFSSDNQPTDFRVGFVDDVLRHRRWPAKEFFYEILHAAMTHGLGIEVHRSLRQQLWAERTITPRSMPADVPRDGDFSWARQYQEMDAQTAAMMGGYLDPQVFYFGYEMSPGLRTLLDSRGIRYLDFRISPVRFLPDLAIAVCSNDARMNKLLHAICLTRRDISIYAAKLGASYRHKARYETVWRNTDAPPPLIFVGQMPDDDAVIVDGRYFDLQQDAASFARQLTGRRISYLPNPSAQPAYIQASLAFLAGFDPAVSLLSGNGYDLLCSEDRADFIGVSSNFLQEAGFFGKLATSILPPICPLNYRDEAAQPEAYYQITFETFTSEGFLGAILGCDRAPPAPGRIAQMQPNNLRELHDAWWGYAEHRGKPNALVQVQQADIHTRLNHLSRTTRFLLELVSDKPKPASDALAEKLHSIHWNWTDGSIIRFDRQGVLWRNGEKLGSWRVRLGAEAEFIAIWGERDRIDVITLLESGRLSCRSHLEEIFEISANGPNAPNPERATSLQGVFHAAR